MICIYKKNTKLIKWPTPEFGIVVFKEGSSLTVPVCAPLLHGVLLVHLGCLQQLQERIWFSLLWQQQVFVQGSNSAFVIGGQNVLVYLNCTR